MRDEEKTIDYYSILQLVTDCWERERKKERKQATAYVY